MSKPRRPSGTARGQGSYVNQACVACRRRKIKCDGGKPSCIACIVHGREQQCIYGTRLESQLEYIRQLESVLDHYAKEYPNSVAGDMYLKLRPPNREELPESPGESAVEVAEEGEEETGAEDVAEELLLWTESLELGEEGRLLLHGATAPFRYISDPSRLPPSSGTGHWSITDNPDESYTLLTDSAEEMHYNPNLSRALNIPLKSNDERRRGDEKELVQAPQEPVSHLRTSLSSEYNVTPGPSSLPMIQNLEPARLPTRSANLEQVWPLVAAGLDCIMFNLPCDLFELRKVIRDFVGQARREKPRELEYFYSKLKDYFDLHVEVIVWKKESKYSRLNGRDLLQYYQEEWRHYENSVKKLELPFSHWDRYWVRQRREQGTLYLYGSQTLALLYWKFGFLESIQGPNLRVTEAVLDMLTQKRNRMSINEVLPRTFIDSLVTLGFDDASPQSQHLVFYTDDFEEPFLRSTTKFYSKLAAAPFAADSLMLYLIYVEDCFKTEETHVAPFLPETRRQNLLSVCSDVLIGSHMDHLCGEFERHLTQGNTEHLRRIYAVMSHNAEGHSRLQVILKAHFKGGALATVSDGPQVFDILNQNIQGVVITGAKKHEVSLGHEREPVRMVLRPQKKSRGPGLQVVENANKEFTAIVTVNGGFSQSGHFSQFLLECAFKDPETEMEETWTLKFNSDVAITSFQSVGADCDPPERRLVGVYKTKDQFVGFDRITGSIGHGKIYICTQRGVVVKGNITGGPKNGQTFLGGGTWTKA